MSMLWWWLINLMFSFLVSFFFLPCDIWKGFMLKQPKTWGWLYCRFSLLSTYLRKRPNVYFCLSILVRFYCAHVDYNEESGLMVFGQKWDSVRLKILRQCLSLESVHCWFCFLWVVDSKRNYLFRWQTLRNHKYTHVRYYEILQSSERDWCHFGVFWTQVAQQPQNVIMELNDLFVNYKSGINLA